MLVLCPVPTVFVQSSIGRFFGAVIDAFDQKARLVNLKAAFSVATRATDEQLLSQRSAATLLSELMTFFLMRLS